MAFTNDKDSDNYTTDKKGWELIKKYIPKNQQIWAPFFCDGKQKIYFKEMGYDIIHEDKDFFKWTPNFDIIVDNIPFSKWKLICTRLKALNKPFIIISFPKIVLLKGFTDMFKDHLQIIIPNKRPTFSHLLRPTPHYSPPFGSWFFCFKMDLPKDLIFLK